MKAKLVRLLLTLCGFLVWPSWSGFGVTTSWPNIKHGREIKLIMRLLKFLPKDTWVIEGPMLAAGGALVIYAWPKSDPHLL